MPDAFSLAERTRLLAASNCTIAELAERLRFSPRGLSALLNQQASLAEALVEGQSEAQRLIREGRG